MYSIRPFRRASEFPSKRSERVFFIIVWMFNVYALCLCMGGCGFRDAISSPFSCIVNVSDKTHPLHQSC